MSPAPLVGLEAMSKVTCQIAISLDGYVAGPRQSTDDPLGIGGERLHEWMFASEPHPVDAEITARLLERNGAYVMGRNMFGPIRGAWEGDWRGWWGEDPPYHTPVFVLTHHPRESVEMAGGTTFHFVTEGLDVALERAREAAGGRDVCIGGGASTVNQVLAAGQLDELQLHIAPIVLGAGERLFVDVGDPAFEVVEAVTSPAVTHIRYRVVR
jgi:dihydrofolate reductase